MDKQVSKKKKGKRLPKKPAAGLPVASGTSFTVSSERTLGEDLIVQVNHHTDDQFLGQEFHRITPDRPSFSFRTHPSGTQVEYRVYKPNSDELDQAEADGTDKYLPPPRKRERIEWPMRIEPTGLFGATPLHAIIIGSMKAGTTTLYMSLKEHPQLAVNQVRYKSSLKESDHFIYAKRHDSDATYAWRFAFEPGVHKATLDASPNYTKWPLTSLVAERMTRIGTPVKLIYLMRDPVARLESHLNHNIEARRFKKKQPRIGDALRPLLVSAYALQLDQFGKFFREGNLLLVDFDELVSQPEVVSHRVCDFLGIDRHFAAVPPQNQSKLPPEKRLKIKNPRRERFRVALRADIERLITDYNFEPARKWLPN